LIAAKERYESAIAASDKAVTQAKQAVLDAEQKLKEDQAELARVRALPPDAYLQSYEVAITQARLALDQANADYAGKLATGGANTELDLLVRQVEQAQVDLDKLLAKQESSRLVAPFDGRVTAAQGRPGDQISAYQTIAIVSDPGTLAVK